MGNVIYQDKGRDEEVSSELFIPIKQFLLISSVMVKR